MNGTQTEQAEILEQAKQDLDTSRLVPIIGNYISALRSATETEVTGLNASVNWALSMTLAVVAFVSQALFRDQKPSQETLVFELILVAGAACMLIHFSIRTAKAYINIIRFSTIERACLCFIMSDTPPKVTLCSSESYGSLIETISEYHVSWRSPISLVRISRKTVLEFGFIYHMLAMFGIMFYLADRVYQTNKTAVYVVVAGLLVSVLLELYAFRRSAYGRSVRIDRTAQDLG